jgi:hypothetical protein
MDASFASELFIVRAGGATALNPARNITALTVRST